MAAPMEEVPVKQVVKEDERNGSFLTTLPDELLLKIMQFLSTFDLLSLREVDDKLSEICSDSSLFRNVDLQKCYHVSAHTLWELGYVVKAPSILSFNLSHCYWLTSNQLSSLNPRMPNLKHLDIRGSAISVKTLNQILSSASSLRSLSYEHRWMMKAMDFSEQAKETWSQLRELNVVITRTCIHAYLFSFCYSLEAFSLETSHHPSTFSECKCEGSFMSYLILLGLKYIHFGREAAKLHPKSCTYHIPYGYGFLTEMKSLSYVSFAHSKYLQYEESWAKNPDCAPILSLEVDDISSNCSFMDSLRLQRVRHLNIKRRNVTQKQLFPVKHYSELRSLNISGCQKVFVQDGAGQLDLSFIEALVEAKIPLRHLNMSGIHLHHLNTDNRLSLLLGKLQGLKSLSLPICGLAGNENSQSQPAWMTSSPQPTNPSAGQQESSGSFSKRQRVGLRTNTYNMCEACVAGEPASSDNYMEGKDGCIYCRSNLARIVNGNPWLESLELMGVDCGSVLSQRLNTLNLSKYTPCQFSTSWSVSEDTLLCISRWTHLHSLVLAGLPTIVRGHCLVAITQSCRQLRLLSLAHLGPSGQCQFLRGLCEALQYAEHLEDFRLEHFNIDGMHMLFRALHRCPSITRVCIISKNGNVNPDDVCVMFNHCPKLVVFCLLCSLSSAACKCLKQRILRSFGYSRPALRVIASQYPLYLDQLGECLTKGMPDVHLREFLLFDSKVAVTPPSWRELEAIQESETSSAW